MGHIRVGRLPKTQPWVAVFGALERDNIDVNELARTTAQAAQQELAALEGDPSINYCFWFLVRIVTGARSNDFAGELERIGVHIVQPVSGLSFVQQVSRALNRGLSKRGDRSVFVRMAELSLRETLSSYIVEQSKSLFGTSLKEIESACRAISSRKRFGQVTKEFFARFSSRIILFLVDKELSNYIGADGSLDSPQQVLEFQRALDRHCYESSKIIEDFAAGWFSKQNWESNNDISEEQALGFTSYALHKIQMELREAQL